MNINELAKEIHENAVAHGWWEEPRKFPEIAALIHSEISEALEEYRDGKPLIYGTCAVSREDCEHYEECSADMLDPSKCKPEGIAVELADAIIRILDFTASEGIDIDAVILAKHKYNLGRPYRHGGKKA
jgi:hypothetical protein